MRTITQQRDAITRSINLRASLTAHGLTQLTDVIDAALAEVPTVLRERIGMWDRLIGKSTDDDEIRDAQAAQSELRWLLLQLEGEKS